MTVINSTLYHKYLNEWLDFLIWSTVLQKLKLITAIKQKYKQNVILAIKQKNKQNLWVSQTDLKEKNKQKNKQIVILAIKQKNKQNLWVSQTDLTSCLSSRF